MTHDLTDKGMAAIWDDVRHNGSVPDSLTKISAILDYQVAVTMRRIRDAAYEDCAKVAEAIAGDSEPLTDYSHGWQHGCTNIATGIRSLSKPLEKENGRWV